jgi:hypothetical protein
MSVDHTAGPRGRNVPVPESLSEYAREVFAHWELLLTGALALVLGLYTVVAAHVLGVRAWAWFAVAFLAWSAAQFLSFHHLRQERDDMLAATATERVSLYAVAASRGVAPRPVVAPRAYQLHALRQVLEFLRGEGFTEVDTSTLDSLLKRLERDGVQLTYEPLGAYDCQDGLTYLVETGELGDDPEDRGFSYRLSPAAATG